MIKIHQQPTFWHLLSNVLTKNVVDLKIYLVDFLIIKKDVFPARGIFVNPRVIYL